MFGKAKLGNEFRWQLKEMGYTEKFIEVATEAQKALEAEKLPIQVAVMGCVVNGPGEAREADIGVAGGNGIGILFATCALLLKRIAVGLAGFTAGAYLTLHFVQTLGVVQNQFVWLVCLGGGGTAKNARRLMKDPARVTEAFVDTET